MSITEGDNYDAIRGNNIKANIDKKQGGEMTAWPAIYNLEKDPGETNPLPPIGVLFDEFNRALQNILGGNRPEIEAMDESKIDPETRRQLEALGYL